MSLLKNVLNEKKKRLPRMRQPLAISNYLSAIKED